jgi:hypothetical protein
MTPDQMKRITDYGEMTERAFGVTTGQQAGYMGAARRAGVSNETKAFANTLGTALAAHLSGSRIGEFLDSMAGSLDSLRSEGFVIDESSLRGFAGVLASLPVFSSDPQRAFRAAEGLNKTFTQGDRLQKAMSFRAMQTVAAGERMTPAEMEVRQGLGLWFGGGDKSSKEVLAAAGRIDPHLRKVLETTSGPKVAEAMFNIARSYTKGLTGGGKVQQFAERMDLNMADATVIYDMLNRNKGQMSGSIKAKLQEARMSPEEKAQKRMETTYQGFDKSIMSLKESMNALKDTLANDVSKVAADLYEKAKDLGASIDALAKVIEVLGISMTLLAIAQGGTSMVGALAGLGTAAGVAGTGGMIMAGVGIAALAATRKTIPETEGQRTQRREMNQKVKVFQDKFDRIGNAAMENMYYVPEGAGGRSTMYGTPTEEALDKMLAPSDTTYDKLIGAPVQGGNDLSTNTNATAENTAAIVQLISALQGKGTLHMVFSKFPSNAEGVGGMNIGTRVAGRTVI